MPANVSEPNGPGNLCARGAARYPGSNALTGGTAGAGNGVIMSYCHLLVERLDNIGRTFGQGHNAGVLPERVAQRMSMAIENASALSGSCISLVDDSSDITLRWRAPAMALVPWSARRQALIAGTIAPRFIRLERQ